jgi:DNA processing protein
VDLRAPRWVERAGVFAARPQAAEGVRFEGLWVSGSLSGLARPAIAVVGSRAPSDGGRERARVLARSLAQAGICVVSGLALGIDGAAHLGALEGSGQTIGILGGGHRHFFPRANRTLAQRILDADGAVVSPYAPDDPVYPSNFLQRNGVVVALVDAVVIVEAAARSGALNTASWAAARNIPVFAFPGDVDRPKAAGCNALIRDGVTLARDAGDVLADLRLANGQTPLPLQAAARTDPLERTLIDALAEGPVTLDTLVERSGAAAGAVLSTLVRLELARAVERRNDGTFAYTLLQ